jgi:hypothetical protein
MLRGLEFGMFGVLLGNSNSLCSRPRPPDRDALSTQHHGARRAAVTHRSALGIGHVPGTAQRHPIGFRYRRPHLRSGVHTQSVECILYAAQYVPHGQRQRYFGIAHCPQRGLRSRLHLAVPFFACEARARANSG